MVISASLTSSRTSPFLLRGETTLLAKKGLGYFVHPSHIQSLFHPHISFLPMNITPTLFAYYQLCHRKMWLHAHHIRMEHSSDLVYEGKLLHDHAYPQRAERYREIVLDGAKIDYYDPKKKVVHEIKKSDKNEHAHIAQLKYYLYLLEAEGIEGPGGLLEYPSQRKRHQIQLEAEDRERISVQVEKASEILLRDCPGRLPRKNCRKCSYEEFCFAEEVVDI
ncbi:MAG: CRISPR-associated protein Cas4 [Bacteroidota bacterium]